MKFLILMSVILVCITGKVGGFTCSLIAAIVTCVLFAGRYVGHHCRMNNVAVIEGLGLFFHFTFALILKRFDPLEFLLLIVIRAAFLFILYYDDTYYVYVTKEERRN